MTQQTSPFLEGKWGWTYGESGWNSGMDENLLKFSFLFDGNITAIVSTLPAPVNGNAYFLTSDNRLYFAVAGVFYASPTPKWFTIKLKSTGETYQFNGSSLSAVDSNSALQTKVAQLQTTIATYGTAATKNTEYFASQTALDDAVADQEEYTDDAIFTLKTDLLATAVGKGSDLIGNASQAVRLSQQGCVEGADITTPFIAANNLATLLGTYLEFDLNSAIVTGDVLLTSKVRGLNCVLTGAHKLIARAMRLADISGFTCTNFSVEGLVNSRIQDIIVTQQWTIDGYNENFGVFYNTWQNIRTGWTVVVVDKQAVNGNTIIGCMGNDPAHYGLTITDNGATSSLGIMESHGQNWSGFDASHSLGVRNVISVRNQSNSISGYFEHGANITGKWNVGTLPTTIDGSTPPKVDEINWVVGLTEVNAAAMGDSIPLRLQNICVGGDWNVQAANGVPPGFSASYAAAPFGIINTPWGYTGAYGGVTSSPNQSLVLNFSSTSGIFSAFVWAYAPTGQKPFNIVIDDGLGNLSYRQPDDQYYVGYGGFFIYRISGIVAKNAASKISFAVTDGSGNYRNFNIGAAYITCSKATVQPIFVEPKSSETIYVNSTEMKKGRVSVPLTSTGTFVDVVINHSSFRGGIASLPMFTVSPGDAYLANFTKAVRLNTITSTQFTVRIYFTTSFAGTVDWFIVGA